MARENGSVTGVAPTNGRRPKVLNLSTYKLHALGDYTSQIRMFGTTDSYSTQSVGHIVLRMLSSTPFVDFLFFFARGSWSIVPAKAGSKEQAVKRTLHN